MSRLPPNPPEPNHGRRAIETTEKVDQDQGIAHQGPSPSSETERKGIPAEQEEQVDGFLDAIAYSNEFGPRKGIDYGWVLKNSIDHYNSIEKDYDIVDSKAQSLIAYFGAGTGILAVGVILAVSEHKISHLVGWAFAPSIACGLAAIILAACSRRTKVLECGPTLKGMSQCIDFYFEQRTEDGCDVYTDEEVSKMAEYSTIARWDQSAARNGIIMREKCDLYNKAIGAFILSAIGLVIPYLTVLRS